MVWFLVAEGVTSNSVSSFCLRWKSDEAVPYKKPAIMQLALVQVDAANSKGQALGELLVLAR